MGVRPRLPNTNKTLHHEDRITIPRLLRPLVESTPLKTLLLRAVITDSCRLLGSETLMNDLPAASSKGGGQNLNSLVILTMNARFMSCGKLFFAMLSVSRPSL